MKSEGKEISKPIESDNFEEVKKEYLQQGFIDAADYENSIDLEKKVIGKKVSAVYIKQSHPELFTGLQIEEFADLKGYGFSLPNGKGDILLVSRYFREPEMNKPPKGWLFKIED